MKAKIVYLVQNLRPCGPTTQLGNILRHLDEECYAWEVVCLSTEKSSGAVLDELIARGTVVRRLGIGKAECVASRVGLAAPLASLTCDILHSQGLFADMLALSAPSHVAKVATQRNYPYDDYPQKFGRIAGYLMAWYHCRVLRKVPNVVGCSQAIQKLNNRQGIRSTFIQNGVEMEGNATPNPEARRRIRGELGIADSDVVFVSVGSLIKRKRMEELIKAFRLGKQGQSRHLVVLGEGPCRSEMERIGGGDIRLMGNVSNVGEYLAASDCFVSCSESEGLPNAVLEAMRARLPVLLSDIPQHREILDIDPRAGWLFGLGDVKNLASLMQAFEPSSVASDASWNIVSNTLSAAMMSQKYQALYKELLER